MGTPIVKTQHSHTPDQQPLTRHNVTKHKTCDPEVVIGLSTWGVASDTITAENPMPSAGKQLAFIRRVGHSKKLLMSLDTQKVAKTGSVNDLHRSGRPRKTYARGDRVLKLELKIERRQPESTHEIFVSLWAKTYRRRLYADGYATLDSLVRCSQEAITYQSSETQAIGVAKEVCILDRRGLGESAIFDESPFTLFPNSKTLRSKTCR